MQVRKMVVPGLTLALLGAFALGTGSAPTAASDAHLALKESAPAGDSTVVVAPTEIRLTFTQEPQKGGTTIRLMTAADSTMIPTTKAAEQAEDGAILLAPIEAPVRPGQYLVVWRTLAADGHAVSGEFTFRYQPAEGG